MFSLHAPARSNLGTDVRRTLFEAGSLIAPGLLYWLWDLLALGWARGLQFDHRSFHVRGHGSYGKSDVFAWKVPFTWKGREAVKERPGMPSKSCQHVAQQPRSDRVRSPQNLLCEQMYSRDTAGDAAKWCLTWALYTDGFRYR